jgi:hypothetical protein
VKKKPPDYVLMFAVSTDDTMRRIEEALSAYERMLDASWGPARAKLLATIRAALQPDAGGWGEDDDRHRANEEHERAVVKWHKEAVSDYRNGVHHLLNYEIDEALRLMRRQPTVQKPTNPSTVSSSETTNTETTDG